jgi:hypothetical protein
MMRRENPTRWDDCLLEGLPEDLLHWFACDCAQRALLREKSEDRIPDPRSWDAIETKRLWLMKRASREVLHQAYEDAQEAARAHCGSTEPKIRGFRKLSGRDDLANWGSRPPWQEVTDRVSNKNHLARNAAWAAAWAAKPTSDAARISAWEAAMATESVGDTIIPEREWQFDHLWYLKEVWQVCGERSMYLLYDGVCPIEKSSMRRATPTYEYA